MLVAGSGTGGTSAFSGAFSFAVAAPPSDSWWYNGSAYSSHISIVYYIYDLDREKAYLGHKYIKSER